MLSSPSPAAGQNNPQATPKRLRELQRAARPLPRLLDEHQAKYFKFNGREPRTLEELAIARADHEHRRRLAEIKAIATKLAQLDRLRADLADRGISLSRHDCSTWDGGKTLRISQGFALSSDNKLCDALLELGFREIERKDSFRDEQNVTLKYGRHLVVNLTVKKPAAPEGGAA